MWLFPAIIRVALATAGWLWIVALAWKDKWALGLFCIFWPGMFLYAMGTWPKCRAPMKLVWWGLAFYVASLVVFRFTH